MLPWKHQHFAMKQYNIIVIITCLIWTTILTPAVRSTPITVPLSNGKEIPPLDVSSSNGLPCIHATAFRQQGPSSNLFATPQSDGRILNKQPPFSEGASGGGINTQQRPAAAPLNSRQPLVTKNTDVGIAAFSAHYSNGPSCNHGQAVPLLPVQPLQHSNQQLPFIMGLLQPPTQLPAPAFYPAKLTIGNVVPSQVLSGHIQGYGGNHKAGIMPQTQHHAHLPSVIHGIGLAPAPAPSNNVFNPGGLPSGIGAGAVFNPSLLPPHRPFGNVPLPSSSAAAVHQSGAAYAQNFQHGSNTYTTASASSNSFYATPSVVGPSEAGSLVSTLPGGVVGNGGPLPPSVSTHFSTAPSNFLNLATSGSSGALSGHLSHLIQETVAGASLDPSVEKHIYVHVPPEDLEENLAGKQQAATLLPPSKPRKHYKIIFIKAPSVAPTAAHVQLASANLAPQTEEKTLIYVLVKKPEEPSLQEIQQIQQQTSKHNKPEVYFIKYKTRSQESENNSKNNNNVGPLEGIDIRLEDGGGSSSSAFSSSSSSLTDYSASSTSLNPGGGYLEPQNHNLNGVPLE